MVRWTFRGKMDRGTGISNARVRARNMGKTLKNIKSRQTKKGRVVTGRLVKRKK